MTTVSFKQMTLQGEDATKFLQGQVTVNVKLLDADYRPTAIANIKGRIDFGLWVKKLEENQFDIVISADCEEAFQAHFKKYGAFYKVTLSEPVDIYPCVLDEGDEIQKPSFSLDADKNDPEQWMARSIATGNYWITEATRGQFQPQELRLHQRDGVHYNKGCYLGQEVIARIYFKASPKAFLHRVKGDGDVPEAGESLDKIQVVNALATEGGFEALVVARPEKIEESDLQVIDLPPALQADVARNAE